MLLLKSPGECYHTPAKIETAVDFAGFAIVSLSAILSLKPKSIFFSHRMAGSHFTCDSIALSDPIAKTNEASTLVIGWLMKTCQCALAPGFGIGSQTLLQSNFVLMNFQLFIANCDNIAPGDAIAISYITWFLSNFALHCYIEGNL